MHVFDKRMLINLTASFLVLHNCAQINDTDKTCHQFKIKTTSTQMAREQINSEQICEKKSF